MLKIVWLRTPNLTFHMCPSQCWNLGPCVQAPLAHIFHKFQLKKEKKLLFPDNESQSSQLFTVINLCKAHIIKAHLQVSFAIIEIYVIFSRSSAKVEIFISPVRFSLTYWLCSWTVWQREKGLGRYHHPVDISYRTSEFMCVDRLPKRTNLREMKLTEMVTIGWRQTEFTWGQCCISNVRFYESNIGIIENSHQLWRDHRQALAFVFMDYL